MNSHHYRFFYLFFLNLALVSLVLFLISNFNFLKIPFLSVKLLFTLFVGFSGSSIISRYNYNLQHGRHTQNMETLFETAPYFFLSILIILAINQFLKIDFILDRNFYLIVLGILFGFLSFYKKIDIVQKEIENEKQNEEHAENIRYENFEHKFPILSRVWGIKSITRWMYKEGWIYSIGLIFIVILGFILRIWNIYRVGYGIDEGIYYIVFNNFSKGSFLPLLDSGGLYLRNFIYTYPAYFLSLVLQNQLIALRSISLIFGIGIIILTYNFVKKLLNKKTALFAGLLISIFTYFIFYSFHGKHYLMILFFYIWFLYLICFYSPAERKWQFLFLSIILGLNYEYVFLFLPLLSFLGIKKNDRSYILPIFIILSSFVIQYFIMSKWISLTLPGFEPAQNSLVNLKFLTADFFVLGFQKFSFLISPFILLLGTLLIINATLKNKLNVNRFLIIILTQLLIEIVFFSFFFEKNPIRYRQSVLFLLVIFMSYLYYNISISLKKKTFVILFGIIILIYLVTPVDLSYPPTSGDLQDKSSYNYKILQSIFTAPYSFSSISGNVVITNYQTIANMDFSNKKIITTDMYNVIPYVKADYILNDYLKNYYSYEKDGKNVSIYNNLIWLGSEELDEIIIGNKVVLLADSRFKTNLNQETKELIYDKFKLIKSTQSDYIGLIDGADKNNIEIWESK